MVSFVLGASLLFILDSREDVLTSPIDFGRVFILLEITLKEACPTLKDPRFCKRFSLMVIPKGVGLTSGT